MRISRVFTSQPLEPGQAATLDAGTSHYLLRVLRLRPGMPLVLFNGDGFDYAAEVVEGAGGAAGVAVASRLPAVPESRLRVTLVQAISRGERMDYTLQKATELGAAAFRPVFTERVEVRLDRRRENRRMAHWRSVIRAACEQSGRAVVPELHAPVRLDQWLGQASGAQRLVLDAEAQSRLSTQAVGGSGLELLVGPEGGLSGRENELLEAAKIKPVRLGPRILRTETAGPAALAVLQALGGDI